LSLSQTAHRRYRQAHLNAARGSGQNQAPKWQAWQALGSSQRTDLPIKEHKWRPAKTHEGKKATPSEGVPLSPETGNIVKNARASRNACIRSPKAPSRVLVALFSACPDSSVMSLPNVVSSILAKTALSRKDLGSSHKKRTNDAKTGISPFGVVIGVVTGVLRLDAQKLENILNQQGIVFWQYA